MVKHKKFQLILISLVLCIIGFNFISISGEFFLNPFYVLSFIIAIILIVKSINYKCPDCGRNQVIRSFLNYKLPKKKCYSCGSRLDPKDD
ncbi:hypothetical protein TUM4438_45920 [Shewanella sairae]|uniref:Uncharacterized protein n=1 Tax=Shewanella sairae TaxID=190310 RepID=A0ABQ4PSV7_9GAMM|nr:hypothetical protein TUM4438_45920 [Shewanella sairae]